MPASFSVTLSKRFLTEAVIPKTDVPILITGPSGTGKELIARLIHYHSSRTGKFIPVNCSAIPAGIMESELFGSEKGSYTGSYRTKPGLFETADKGTIFLDEIGEMDSCLQSKLLRVLQEGEITRIGSSEPIKINTRIIAATNIDIEKEVTEKKFREDLYYRLNGVNIRIPPLKERKEEIRHLCRVFLMQFNEKYKKNILGINDACLEILINYSWPGNIRELKNKIEEAVIFCNSDRIKKEDIKFNFNIDSNPYKYEESPLIKNETTHDIRTALFSNSENLPQKLINAKKTINEEFEKQFILFHLNKNSWKVSKTAKSIGMYRQDLYKKIKSYGLKKTS